MKKADYIIISIIIVSLIAIYFIWNMAFSQDGQRVSIVKDNKEIASYSLNHNVVIGIKNDGCNEITDNYDEYSNVFSIFEGEVNMIKANCPDKICVNHIEISKSGEAIVCMPNKTYITIE